jgi:hypothetical protein
VRLTRVVLAGVLAAGCGASPHATTGHGTTRPERQLRRGPIGRVLVPAQLGDAGALERIPFGAHVSAFGKVWLVLDGEPKDGGGVQLAHLDEVWPVIAEAGDRVQIVSSEDNLHLALWVSRVDLATSISEDIIVAGRPVEARAIDPEPDAPFAILRGGARVAVTARARAEDATEVRFRQEVELAGWVPAPAVGEVFRVDRSPPAADHVARPPATIVDGTLLYAAPDTTSRALVRARAQLPVRATGKRERGWTEVLLDTPHVRVRGWAQPGAITDGPAGSTGSTGRGSGAGSSGRRPMEVPAGTCIYAAIENEVIGVASSTQTRLVLQGAYAGWWNVLVSSSWGLHEVYVHDITGGRDVSTARLESCAEPAGDARDGPPVGAPLTN